jgi:hypothetical protein
LLIFLIWRITNLIQFNTSFKLHTINWSMNHKRSPFHVIGNSIQTSAGLLSTMCPSRNKNYIRGKIIEGDRYVAIRNDDQLELARHLFSKVGFFSKFDVFSMFDSRAVNCLPLIHPPHHHLPILLNRSSKWHL